MAKYIDPNKIIELINKAKIQYYTDSYQNLLNEEYGLDDANTDTYLLGTIRLLIITLEYEFSLDEQSQITYDLYIKLAKLIRQYDFSSYVIDDTLQVSDIKYVYLGSGASRFTQLLDTPDSYSGHAGQVVIVNNSETGLVFSEFEKVPSSFINKTLSSSEVEVVLDWSTVSDKHGIKPIYIDLYQVTNTGYVQSTSKVYTEDNGLTYRWYVSNFSPRIWEIRILGYVEGNTEVPTENWSDTLVWNDNNIWQD